MGILSAIFSGVFGILKSIPWQVWAIIAAVTVLFGGGCNYGERRVQAKWDAEKQAVIAKAANVKQQQDAVTAKVDIKAGVAQERVRTVFKDRIIIKDSEVPREIIVRHDAGCVIPNRFVSLWNSANRAELPDTASLLDGAASRVVLSDIEAQKDREAELCIANTEQLKLLQHWVREQMKVTQ